MKESPKKLQVQITVNQNKMSGCVCLHQTMPPATLFIILHCSIL